MKLKIKYVDSPFNPREWDNIGIMCCFHKKYLLGDKHNIDNSQFENWDEVKEYLIKEEKAIVILPLYLYDHSGITISTTPFPFKWDSGQVGFIYTTEKRIKELMRSEIESIGEERLIKNLRSEVEIYDKYLRGECYEWEIIDDNGKTIDSCSGFFDEKECEEAGKIELNHYEKQKKKKHFKKVKTFIKYRVPLKYRITK